MVTLLETLRLAPAGSAQIHHHLITVRGHHVCNAYHSCNFGLPSAQATKTLSAGGDTGIFTPMLFVKARKPLNAAAPSVRIPNRNPYL